MPLNETHDPGLRSWVDSANDPASDFPIQNLPVCRVCAGSPAPHAAHLGVAIGEHVLDLTQLARAGYFDDDPALAVVLRGSQWTGEAQALSPALLGRMRRRVQAMLRADNRQARVQIERQQALRPQAECRFLEPVVPPNFTDFYASIDHAAAVGAMFRPDQPLLPNYRHVPIAYHGRASSVVISGTEIIRPVGQQAPPEADPSAGPAFGPTRMLDYELEVGLIVGTGNPLGQSIPIDQALAHLLGICLVNDWSARDLQRWEYQPLGPFLGKNFATTISPFIVTMEALEPFRCPARARPAGEPRPLPYLWDARDQSQGAIDLTLEVWLQSEQMRQRGMAPVRLSHTRACKDLYWTPGQMIAHHTVNGCNLMSGDLIATGTVSGPGPDERGCLLELTWDGPGRPRRPVLLPSGESRTFLADGDEVVFRGYAQREGFRRIGLGECRGRILPARPR